MHFIRQGGKGGSAYRYVHFLWLIACHSLTRHAGILLFSWCQLLEKDGTIEKFVPIDFADSETVFDRCLEVRPIVSPPSWLEVF